MPAGTAILHAAFADDTATHLVAKTTIFAIRAAGAYARSQAQARRAKAARATCNFHKGNVQFSLIL